MFLHNRFFCAFAVIFPIFCGGCSKSAETAQEAKPLYEAPLSSDLELLDRAMSNYDREYYTVSREAWTELLTGYPTSYYATLAELKNADSHFYATEYDEALIAYEEFLRLHRGHEAVPYVLFQIANTHLQRYRGTKRDQTPLRAAMTSFSKLLEQYPTNLYGAISREKIKECRELLAEYEAFVVEFYHKQGMEEASLHRKQRLQEEYPESVALMQIGANEDALETEVHEQQNVLVSEEAKKYLLPKVPVVTLGQSLGKGSSEKTEPTTDIVVAKLDNPALSSSPEENTPKSESELLHVSCEAGEDFSIFTAYLKHPMSAERPVSLENLWQVTLKPRNDYLHTTENKSLDCEAGNASISISQSAKNQLIEASLSLPDPSAVRFFLLDRPSRAVFLISKQ